MYLPPEFLQNAMSIRPELTLKEITGSLAVAESTIAINTGACQFPTGIDQDVLDRVRFALSYYRHLRRLNVFVEACTDRPVRLADVAQHIGISPSRLSRLFLEKTGIRFSDWVCHVRITKAIEMLLSSDKTISEIALSAGFGNSRSFERSFRKVCGFTASQFRNQQTAQ